MKFSDVRIINRQWPCIFFRFCVNIRGGKIALAFLTLISSCFVLKAGNESRGDSLKKILEKSTDTSRAKILYQLAGEYLGSDAERSKHYSQAGLDLSRKLGFKKGEAKSLAALGLANYYQGKYTEAVYFLKEAFEVCRKSGDLKGCASSSANIGMVYHDEGEFNQATTYYMQGKTFAEKGGEKIILGNILNNLGLNYHDKGDYLNALDYSLKALQIREALHTKKDQAGTLGNIGMIYKDLRKFDLGIHYHQMALDLYKEVNDVMGSANSYTNMASVFIDQGEFDKALPELKNALNLYKEIRSKKGIAKCYNNIGLLWESKGDLVKASEFYEDALKLKEEIGDKPGMINTLVNLGSVMIRKSDFKHALEYAGQGLSLAREMNSLAQQKECYALLSAIYKGKKDFETALKYYTLFSQIKDSIFNSETSRDMATMQARYDNDTKEKEIEMQKLRNTNDEAELKKKDLQRNALIAGIVLILILSFVLYNRYQVKQKANGQLTIQKQLIEEKNKNITDSINYSKRIQEALMATEEQLNKFIPGIAILYKPKDIVSGDFYWMQEKGGYIYLAAADCTGHGVPGALMSMMGFNFLNEIMAVPEVTETGQVLDRLHRKVLHTLHQGQGNVRLRDGMDIALVRIDPDKHELQFSGAGRPLYYYDGQELLTIRGDRSAIGGVKEGDGHFRSESIRAEKGMNFYICSDGFADQFGGPEGRKFMSSQLKSLLRSLQTLTPLKQKSALEDAFLSWKGDFEQVDDILMIAFTI